jgi:Gamma-glutamyltranspeptidase
MVAVLLANSCLAVSPPPEVGTNVMVVTAQHYATDVGFEILRRGGNAIDATVAIGYTLAVVHPAAGNLGSGGFMTLHLANGKDTFVNFREKAPPRAARDLYLDANGNIIPGLSTVGYSLPSRDRRTSLGLFKEIKTRLLQDLLTGPVAAPGQAAVGTTLLKGLRYGGWDHRSPAGSARGERSDRLFEATSKRESRDREGR